MSAVDLSCRADKPTGTCLPVLPRPCEDELAHGFLARVAEANGYETPALLASAMRCGAEQGGNALQRCLQLTEANWCRLAGPWPRYYNYEDKLRFGLERADYVLGMFRWCPKCLVSAPYLRSIWSIKFCATCLYHGAYLIDICPRCQRRQRIEHFRGLHCECGQPLTTCESQIAPSDVLNLQAAILAGPYPVGIPQLAPSAWTRLLRFVATMATPTRNGKTGQVAGLQHLSIAAAVIRQAVSIFVDWPEGFHAFLLEVQAKSEVSFSLHRTFGRLYRRLYIDLKGSEFDFLREGFEAYLREHWWGLICRRNQRVKISKEDSVRTTIKAAAKLSGASASRIKQLHLAGLVEATTFEHSSGRKSWSLPIMGVTNLASLVKDGMTLKAASTFLGLPKRRVRDLVDAGLIRPRLVPGRNDSPVWNFSRSELDMLGRVEKVKHEVRSLGLSEKEFVPLLQVLKTWRLPSGAFPALMVALAAGAISGIDRRSRDVSLGQMAIPVSQLKAWLLQWQELNLGSVSITAAAQALGIKEQVAYDLVRVGLLSTHSSGNASARRVMVDAIKQFRETYVTAIELSQVLGISLKTLLRRTGIQPVTGPAIDGGRQYFFNRSDFLCDSVDAVSLK